ncbi:hypothetical protein Nepgr_006800 [Nepenthes gracilis]|uniref:Uncharacterized protein n=1 Tax=Nepenthes gracilis TaxID=150966 RepID=A0AAD3S5S8_NEPGR|nr:hypothetical protein Nepgr_006800 [Nepenthes gracilis]
MVSADAEVLIAAGVWLQAWWANWVLTVCLGCLHLAIYVLRYGLPNFRELMLWLISDEPSWPDSLPWFAAFWSGSCCCYSDFWPESADCLAHGLSLRVDAILISSKRLGVVSILHSYSDDATAEAAVERSLTADSGMKQRIDAEKDTGSGCCDPGRGVHWELDSVAVGLPEVDWCIDDAGVVDVLLVLLFFLRCGLLYRDSTPYAFSLLQHLS